MKEGFIMKTYLQNLNDVIKNINLPFQVMEDNGGGLYLLIFQRRFRTNIYVNKF